jgi:hypothetical protein
MEKKYFMWYDSQNEDHPIIGPYFYADTQAVTSNYYHELEDMLRMPTISESLKRRLKSARTGTRIKIHYLHSRGNMMVKCVTEKDIPQLDEISRIDTEITDLKSRINKLSSRREEICDIL